MEVDFINFIHCYSEGLWMPVEHIPYISMCACQGKTDDSETSYCGPKCLDKRRDDCFYKQYQFENDTDFYPSDIDITSFKDKRIIKLEKVEGKPYYIGGKEMLRILDNAAKNYKGPFDNPDYAYDAALDDIRLYNYCISNSEKIKQSL